MSAPADVVLEVEDVSVALGGRTIVSNVSLRFVADRVHAIVGRSGAGKSVLMKAVCGLLPHTGTVRLHQPPLVFVHQDPALVDTLDVEENVAFALPSQLPQRDARARVQSSLAALGLRDLRRALPSTLGLATQKRVALARALCLRPGVLVVDEPTTGLDPRAARTVDDALSALADTALIVITHSPRTLARLQPEVVLVQDGGARPLPRRAA